jgi:hypothetical protein
MNKSLDELDMLAAIHVMGWELKMPSRVYVIRRESNLPAIDTGKMFNKGPHQNRWKPTRNIAQAWEVIEKLQPFAFGLLYEKLDLQWYCEIEYPALKVSNTEAETAPLAICMAALKAKGIDI